MPDTLPMRAGPILNHLEQTRAELPQLLTSKIAAERLGMSERWLWEHSEPRGPVPVVKLGRSVRYDPRDLAAYIDSLREGRK